MTSRAETPQGLSLKPGKEKERFQLIEPAKPTFYKGPLEGKVSPATIGGTWFPKPVAKSSDLGPDASVVLHVHGGAFVIGDGRTDQLGFMSSSLIKQGGVTAILSLQYRLSSRPGADPFPAALQDTLSSYLYLVKTLQIPPQNITVSGDSAGGNLVIGLLRYLASHGEELGIPQPRSAVLLSPWVSPSVGAGPDIGVTSNPHYESDFLTPEFLRWGAAQYARDVPVTDPYITPLGHPFATPVPVFVNIGAAEVLEIDDTRWVGEMRQVEGNVVDVNYEADAPHDTLLLGNMIGWTESAEHVARHVGLFIRKAARDA